MLHELESETCLSRRTARGAKLPCRSEEGPCFRCSRKIAHRMDPRVHFFLTLPLTGSSAIRETLAILRR